MYRKLIFYTALLALGIFVINALANVFYWYTAIVGFDKVMHLLGGVFLAFFGASLFHKTIKGLHARDMFVTLLLFAFIMGLVWEYYEYVVQGLIKSVDLANIPDSIGDLVCDMLGASIGAYFVILIKKRYNKANGS